MKDFNKLVINGETIEVSNMREVASLPEGAVTKARIRWDCCDRDELQLDRGTAEIKIVRKSPINFSNWTKVEAEIISFTDSPYRLFFFPSERSILISDGYNLGLSNPKDSRKELRLNDVYGRGDIFHLLPVFGIDSWVRVGRYRLRDDWEEMEWTDEEAILAVETSPNVMRKILRSS